MAIACRAVPAAALGAAGVGAPAGCAAGERACRAVAEAVTVPACPDETNAVAHATAIQSRDRVLDAEVARGEREHPARDAAARRAR